MDYNNQKLVIINYIERSVSMTEESKVKRMQIEEIADQLGKEEILCQLSEECAELIQSCLKYRRAIKGLTPKTKNETRDNLFEELADVLLNIEQVMYLFAEDDIDKCVEHTQLFKADRWYRRTFVAQSEE